MTIDELLDLAADMAARELETMRKKNNDYTVGSADPFANFRTAAVLGVDPMTGLLIRVLDKIKRIQTFVSAGTLAVDGEPVDDAIADIRNYMILLQGLVQERRGR